MKPYVWCVLVCGLLSLGLQAAQVTLKNGDRITGDIISVDAKTATVKTAAMGEIQIDRGAIASLASDEQLTLTLKKGEKLVGKVQLDEVKASVTDDAGKIVTVPAIEVGAIRTSAGQAAWEREQTRLTHPPLLDFWSGTIGLNLASASGNARTTTFGTGATAERTTGVDKIALNYSQIYSTQSTTEPFGATANRISGGVRYDRTLHKKLFAFATNSYDFDEFLDLDLRVALGGGLGLHAYKSAKHFLDIGAGLGWQREAFGTGLTRNSAELILTEESSHQLTTILKLFQRAALFPNLTYGGEYRLNFDGGASLRLTKAISWNITLTDRYITNPPPGRKGNDLLLTTGIGVSFQQK